MRRSSALLVSLLLVCGLLAPLVVTADQGAQVNPRIVSINDTANYLTVPAGDVGRTEMSSAGVSLSTALDGETTQLRSEHRRISFEQAFEAAETDQEKSAAVQSSADRVESRLELLVERDRAATRAYANGSMSAAQFARERARIHQEASHLQETSDRIRAVARNDNSYSLSVQMGSRLSGLSGELEALQGPVSERVTRLAAGDAPGHHVYVEAAGDDYTMAYVTSDTYVRETYLGSEHDLNASDASAEDAITSQNGALDRGNELYPWVNNHSISPTVRYLGAADNFKYTAQHTSGELTAYIASDTGNVFRESQRHKLSAMPVSNTVTSTNGTLDMRVNKTYESGPLHVEVTRNSTGVPVNGSVELNGDAVGDTGADGELWTIEPHGPDRVTATTADNETVSAYLPS